LSYFIENILETSDMFVLLLNIQVCPIESSWFRLLFSYLSN